MKAPVDLETLKVHQQKVWSSGDFAVIGTRLLLTAELLAEACDLRCDEQVLDVAAGNGNATLAAARRGCQVTSTDFVDALLERGRERTRAERFDVAFLSADAHALPFEDGRFDAVLSTFGVMFAADQPRAAAELARVCRPGGRIGLACWTPAGFVGQMFALIGRHHPPPAGMASPLLWGTEAHLHALFDATCSLHTEVRRHRMRYRSAGHFIEEFRTWYGPLRQVFSTLPEAAARALHDDLEHLLTHMNQAGPDSLVVPAEYLEVVLTRRHSPA